MDEKKLEVMRQYYYQLEENKISKPPSQSQSLLNDGSWTATSSSGIQEIKEKSTKKRKIVLVIVIANKKIKLQKEKKKRVQVNETSLDEFHFKKPTPTFIDYNEVKKTLSDWKQQKIQCKRETTRLKLEQIKNTADFYGNIDVMNDFYELITSPSIKN
ncbi:hypothetical protein RYX36_009866 [Vicia faba]